MKPKPSPSVSSSPTKPSPRPHRLVKQVQTKNNGEPNKTKKDKVKVDSSVIRYPVHTSVGNLSQILDVVNKATPEVISLVNRECSIIFECKICKSLFRSLANFLSHKRGFCKGTVNEFQEFRSDVPSEKIQKTNMVCARSTSKKDVLALLDTFKNYSVQNLLAENILLKDISATNEAYFNLRYQNQDPSKEKIVTIDPVETPLVNGHCEPDDKGNTCTVCYKEFLSRRTLDTHVKKDHEDLRVCFVCPCCKKYFANAWSVYRHMYKVHRKTSEQVRKLRTQIQKKQVTQEEFNRSKKGNMSSPQEKKNQDKAFMEDLRGHGSVQRCPECGKHFERKAALIAHTAHCQKKSIPPHDLARSLKRKALVPMKIVEEKKAKFSGTLTEEIITRIRNFDPRVVLTKADLPPMYEKSLSRGESEEEDLSVEGVTDLKSLLHKYRDEVFLDEDILNKIHSEVPIEETTYSSESENDYTYKAFTSSGRSYSTTPKRDYLSQDVENLSQDKETISHDRENVSQDRESISQDRESLPQDKDCDSLDEDSVLQDEESVSQEEESISQDEESVSQEEVSVSQEDEGSDSQEDDNISQDEESVLQDDASISQDGDVLSEDGDNLFEDEECFSQDIESDDNNDNIEEFDENEKTDDDAASSLSTLIDEETQDVLLEKTEIRKGVSEDEVNEEKEEIVEIEEVDEENIEIQEVSPENSDMLLDDDNEQGFEKNEPKEVSNIELTISTTFDNNDIKPVACFSRNFEETEVQFKNSKKDKVCIEESVKQLEANESPIYSGKSISKTTERGSELSSSEDEKVRGDISDLDDLECNGFIGFSDPEPDSETELEMSSPLSPLRTKITLHEYESASEQNSKDCLSLEADKDNTCDNLSHSSYISMKHQSVFIESCRGGTSREEGSSPTFDLDDSNYGVAKEIILFNYSEGSISCPEMTEVCVADAITEKDNENKLNGGSASSSPVPESQSLDQDDDVESLVDKTDWLTKKINSFMTAPKKKCLLCYKTFHRINFVRRHVASHFNINKYKCLVNSCNFQSYLRSDLNNHLLRTHKTKELENFVGRLHPKKEDFSEDFYIPDPKPMYAVEKSFKPHNTDLNKENEFRISEKEEEISSSLVLEDETLDGLNIGEEMEIIEEDPEKLICNDLEDVALRSLAVEEPNKEKIKTLMMEVIFGSNQAEDDSEDSPLLASGEESVYEESFLRVFSADIDSLVEK